MRMKKIQDKAQSFEGGSTVDGGQSASWKEEEKPYNHSVHSAKKRRVITVFLSLSKC